MSPEASYWVIEILTTARSRDEAMGTKQKFWCHYQQARWLFKFSRPGTGEHWSEKIAAEVGAALGVRCAHVELAKCGGLPGSLTQSFVTKGSGPLVHGNELLQEDDATYPVVTTFRGVSKHTVDTVLELLAKIEAPESGDPRLASAADVFLGYLLLDAVVMNCDRHHENWGVLQLAGGVRRLAPSYDHASSLGRELGDEARQARLTTPDARHSVEAYIRRARSGFYAEDTDKKALHPADAFFRAVRQRPEAGALWLARIEALGEDEIEKITARVPASAISEPGRAFAHEVLRLGRRMLLNPTRPNPPGIK